MHVCEGLFVFLCEFFVSLFGRLPLEDALGFPLEDLLDGTGQLLVIVRYELLETDYAAVKSGSEIGTLS